MNGERSDFLAILSWSVPQHNMETMGFRDLPCPTASLLEAPRTRILLAAGECWPVDTPGFIGSLDTQWPSQTGPPLSPPIVQAEISSWPTMAVESTGGDRKSCCFLPTPNPPDSHLIMLLLALRPDLQGKSWRRVPEEHSGRVFITFNDRSMRLHAYVFHDMDLSVRVYCVKVISEKIL